MTSFQEIKYGSKNYIMNEVVDFLSLQNVVEESHFKNLIDEREPLRKKIRRKIYENI